MTDRESADLYFGDPRFQGSAHPLHGERWRDEYIPEDEEEDEVEAAAPARAETLAYAIATTRGATDRIKEGIGAEATEAQQEEAIRVLENMTSAVVALVVAAHNTATAMHMLAAELGNGEEGDDGNGEGA